MLNVQIVERARSTQLVALSKVKAAMGFTTDNAARDARLSELIDDVSDAIVAFCGRTFAREDVTEHLESIGRAVLVLDRTPVSIVDEVRFKEEVLEASGYSITDPDAGFLYRDDTWDDTSRKQQWITSERAHEPGRQDWHVDYIGGYLLPNDDFVASGICTASGSTFSLPAEGETDAFPILVSGERIRFAGFANDDNNGTFIVVARTRSSVEVEGTLVHEVASGSVSITTRLYGNRVLPRDVERYALMAVQSWYHAEQRDVTKTSERIGDWSASYASEPFTAKDNFGLPPIAVAGLARYQRVYQG